MLESAELVLGELDDDDVTIRRRVVEHVAGDEHVVAKEAAHADDECADLVGLRIPEDLPHAAGAMAVFRSDLGVEADTHDHTSRQGSRRADASARLPRERDERYRNGLLRRGPRHGIFRFPNLSVTERNEAHVNDANTHQ